MTEQRARGAIDLDDAEVGVEQQLGHRAVLEQRTEAFRALGERRLDALVLGDLAREQEAALDPVEFDALRDDIHRQQRARSGPVARISAPAAAGGKLVEHPCDLQRCRIGIDRGERLPDQLAAVAAERACAVVDVGDAAVAPQFDDDFRGRRQREPQRGGGCAEAGSIAQIGSRNLDGRGHRDTGVAPNAGARQE
jgi:hypothetical protein